MWRAAGTRPAFRGGGRTGADTCERRQGPRPISERITLQGEFLREFIKALCDANQAVVVVRFAADGERPPVPVRMLELSGTSLVIDAPKSGGQAVEMPAGSEIEVRCGLDVGLFQFRTVVRGPVSVVEGGAPSGVALAAPERAEVLQRRGAFRVVLLETRVAARLWPVDRSNWEAEGEVLNASSIGAAVIVEREEVARFRIGEVCLFIFEPVEGIPELRVAGKVVRVAAGPSGHKLLVGVSWRLSDARRDDRALQDRLARFVAARQRPVLRRRSFRLPKG